MNVSDSRQSTGETGEEIALKFLKSIGYKIIARNYECRRGEIDLIAKDRDIIVFVEVKCRRSGAYKPPYISVTRKKEKKILSIADYYLHVNKIRKTRCRFDVVSIVLTYPVPEIKHIRAAFGTWHDRTYH